VRAREIGFSRGRDRLERVLEAVVARIDRDPHWALRSILVVGYSRSVAATDGSQASRHATRRPVKSKTVALLVSLALLSLGLGGCRSEGGGPCCWQGSTELVAAGAAEGCCDLSAPPAAADASGGPWTKSPFSPGAFAFATARFDLVPLEAVAALTGSAVRPRTLYRLDCALRL